VTQDRSLPWKRISRPPARRPPHDRLLRLAHTRGRRGPRQRRRRRVEKTISWLARLAAVAMFLAYGVTGLALAEAAYHAAKSLNNRYCREVSVEAPSLWRCAVLLSSWGVGSGDHAVRRARRGALKSCRGRWYSVRDPQRTDGGGTEVFAAEVAMARRVAGALAAGRDPRSAVSHQSHGPQSASRAAAERCSGRAYRTSPVPPDVAGRPGPAGCATPCGGRAVPALIPLARQQQERRPPARTPRRWRSRCWPDDLRV